MNVMNLEPDEIVIMQEENVSDENNNIVSLVLTNKAIIKSVPKRWSRGTEDYRFPLSHLKENDGNPNVLVGKNSNGKSRLELFFYEESQYYRFKGLLTEKKWANAIIKAYKEYVKELIKSQKEKNAKEFSVSKFFSPIIGGIDATKGAVSSLIKDRKVVACKCPECGAMAEGEKGSQVTCEYCDYVFVIK